MRSLCRAVLLPLQACLLLFASYLLALVGASYLFRDPGHRADGKQRRFAILVPARNEERLLGRLLEGLCALRYPADRYDVHVVADNCDDRTAAVARRFPVEVHERSEPEKPGKAAALGWLLRRIPLDGYDAVVIIDADSTASENLLEVANTCLADGALAVQAHDRVANPEASPASALAGLAFSLHNFVLPLGREALGLSAGLNGNGMVLATCLAKDAEWESFGPAEDAELHASLVQAGQRVHFEPRISVAAEMPTSVAAAAAQNRRWDAGRAAAARRHGLRLLSSALYSRDVLKLGGALDLLLPPLAAQVAGAGLSLLCGVGLRSKLLSRIGLVLLAEQSLTVALAVLRSGQAGPASRHLWAAPGYLVWKSAVYLEALARSGLRLGPRRDG